MQERIIYGKKHTSCRDRDIAKIVMVENKQILNIITKNIITLATKMVDQAEQQPQFHVNTQSVSIQPLPEFLPDAEIGSSLAAKWKLWMEDFEMFILASGITDPKRKRALLLYQAGQHV